MSTASSARDLTAAVNRPTTAALPPSSAAANGLSIQEARKTLEVFKAACRDQSQPAERLDELAQTLQDAGFRHEMSDIVMDALVTPEANHQTGALWIRRLVTSKTWDRTYPKYLDALVSRGEIGTRALLELVHHLNLKSRPKLAERLFSKHGSKLKDIPEARIACIGAMAKGGLLKQVLKWTAGLPAPAEAPIPLLYYRALAFRGLGREREAVPLIDAALARGASADFPLLALWKAMEEGLAGNTATASKFYQELKPAGWDEDTFCEYYLARGVLRVQQANSSRKNAFYSSEARLRDSFRKVRVHRRQWRLRRSYRRCMWRMASDAGLRWRGLLAAWRSADSPLTLLVLMLVPGLQLLAPFYLYRLVRHRREPSR